MSDIWRGLWVLMAGVSLSACSALGSFGGETFILEGGLPADFSLKAQAEYDVADACNGRSQSKTFKKDYESAPHQYRFKIPVNYRSGLCEMQLAKVKLTINGHYGEKEWQQTYDNGGLVIVDRLSDGAPTFQADGAFTKRAKCTWTFQISKLYLEISKQLSCSGAGAYLVRENLPDKVVRLGFELSSKEHPYLNGYWLETSTGWKPCTGRWGTRFEELCTEPPQFRTFRMNERECTVYPNCTE
ncbi:hypothetical protein N8H22_11605 [Stutzerimonas stutzeri]|uniref:hypothetical protein n=1 Tax=Stutzerimonas sp. S1 TaxID=3030652 RepID=UPI0022244941|nr:hypothetical protein [Stutzerimonas sp. S1]MCW3149239.1 hypothetical protein [Stutzerimonas sp. S1]